MKSDLSKLRNTIDKLNTAGSFGPDDRYWKLERDKAGNGSATIRFLPERTEDDLPFVRLFSHGFKGPTGKWFIENCPTTVGGECPCCQSNGDLWAQGTDAAKKVVRDRKRKLSYIVNILVIDDPKKPENNGKVMMFKLGKKIYDMIVDQINPQFDDVEAFNPFCPHTGADFKLRCRKADGFPNYDKSAFAEPAALFDGEDDAIEAVLAQMHDLNKEIAPSEFKSAAELQKKFNMTVGGAAPAPVEEDEEEEEFQQEPIAKKTQPAKARPMPAVSKDDDDSELEYFAKLAAS